MMPHRSPAVHRQICKAGYGLAGKATLFSAAVCTEMFNRTASSRRADYEKRDRYFLIVSRGCRSDRTPPPEEPSESPRHFAASMDESVIVGYYTSVEVPPRSPRRPKSPEERMKIYGKK